MGESRDESRKAAQQRQRRAVADFFHRPGIGAMFKAHAEKYGLSKAEAMDVIDRLDVWAGKEDQR